MEYFSACLTYFLLHHPEYTEESKAIVKLILPLKSAKGKLSCKKTQQGLMLK